MRVASGRMLRTEARPVAPPAPSILGIAPRGEATDFYPARCQTNCSWLVRTHSTQRSPKLLGASGLMTLRGSRPSPRRSWTPSCFPGRSPSRGVDKQPTGNALHSQVRVLVNAGGVPSRSRSHNLYPNLKIERWAKNEPRIDGAIALRRYVRPSGHLSPASSRFPSGRPARARRSGIAPVKHGVAAFLLRCRTLPLPSTPRDRRRVLATGHTPLKGQ